MKPQLGKSDLSRIEKYSGQIADLRRDLSRRIVGQDKVIRQVLAAILSEGHCLIIGVPGLAKTLLVRSISELLTLEFSRIQFTPDLMPSDITGATLLQDDSDGVRGFNFMRGPIFSNVILADEINRTPPKTQAALMEAMEERQVTAAGGNVPLERPFFVLATQNPIEQEGTYPLPVSQMDRFQQSIRIDYPEADEEMQIVQQTTSSYQSSLEPVLDRESISDLIDLTAKISISSLLLDYVSRIVRKTRPGSEQAPGFVKEWVSWGAGPRGVQAIIEGARALALMDGRHEISPGDLHEMCFSTLRHRMVLTYHAEAEGVDADIVIEQILESMAEGHYRPAEKETTNAPGFFRRLLGRS
jgi:MoxR-like ATPase